MQRPRFTFLAGPAGAAALLLSTTLLAVPGAAAAGTTAYVSASGSSGGADTSCSTAAYNTINDAVSAASAGEIVVVCAGTYKEDVAVSKSLTLLGQGADSSIIDAA